MIKRIAPILHSLFVLGLLLPVFSTAAPVAAAAPDAADRITDPAYSYDENGNLLTDESGSYTYDTSGRLVSAQVNGTVTNYAYDGNDNLIEITEDGVTTELVLDERPGLPRIAGEIQGGSTRLYAYDEYGMNAEKHNGTVRYSLRDHQGTIRHMTDAAGAIENTRYYNAWGEQRYQSGTAVPTLGYTGERMMTDGTVYLRARLYRPENGRFLQRDPIDPGMFGRGTQGHHRYSYVENNPVNWVDPSGHIPGLNLRGDFNEMVDSYNEKERSYDSKKGKLGELMDVIKRGVGPRAIADATPHRGIGKEATELGKKAHESISCHPSVSKQQCKNLKNNKREAFRHAKWQAELARKYGEEVAKDIGDAHEASSTNQVDTIRDQIHNEIGRKIGMELKELEDRGFCPTDGYINRRIQEEWDKGRAVKDLDTDPRIPQPLLNGGEGAAKGNYDNGSSQSSR